MIITLLSNKLLSHAAIYNNNVIVEFGEELKNILEKYTLGIDYICGLFTKTALPFRSINYNLVTCYDINAITIKDIDNIKYIPLDGDKSFIKIPDIGESILISNIIQYNVQMFIPSIITFTDDMSRDITYLIKTMYD